MTDRRSPRISSRKQPQQARSAELVAAILEAAVQVLAKEGAQRFTTARVAEKAGVSIGSLYQYFPNKAAILFRLQSDEWRQTTDLLRGILEDVRATAARTAARPGHTPSSDRNVMRPGYAWHSMTPRLFIAMRPRRKQARASGGRTVQVFMQEALPEASEASRALAGDLITTTLSEVGKRFSESPRTPAEIEAYADAMADMFCAYLRGLDDG